MQEKQTNKSIEIIQGGMGIWVSSPELAAAVANTGETGTVSATGAGTVLARKLQDGDQKMRTIVERFPGLGIANRILDKYYLPDGRNGKKYALIPPFVYENDRHCRGWATMMEVVGSFAAVSLAKALSHSGRIGINIMEELKVNVPASLYGAMLAGVDMVAMGAGIPTGEKANIVALANNAHLSYPIDVENALMGSSFSLEFEPEYYNSSKKELSVPRMLAIVSSKALVYWLEDLDKNHGYPPDGYIFEGYTAGGHNAPPRNKKEYSDKDEINIPHLKEEYYEKYKRELNFFLAGSFGNPEGLRAAKASGASGVQAGTVFAFTEESGFDRSLKLDIINRIRSGEEVHVDTDFRASPSGFPFKAIDMPGSLSDDEVYRLRSRICDVRYLRHPAYYEDKVVFRCPAEPIHDYEKKGGAVAETEGRKCLCNALVAAAGLAQVRQGGSEGVLVTSGQNLVHDIAPLIKRLGPNELYSAEDVVRYLKTEVSETSSKAW